MSANKSFKVREFWVVTAALLCVLIFMLSQLTRAVLALRLARFIEDLTPAVSQPYLAASGLVWAAAGLISIWWLARRHAFAPGAIKAIALLFSANYWFEQLWMTSSELRTVNWAFSAALNAVIILGIFLFFSLGFVRRIFGDGNGKKFKIRRAA